MRRGEGVWLEDFDGNRYIDAVSSWWVNIFGHANPAINDRIKTQLDTIEHVMLAGFTHEPAVELAERLVDISPDGLNKVFYADNGSAAVEVALKMSFHYWLQYRSRREDALHQSEQQLSRRDARRAGTRRCRTLQEDLRTAAAQAADGAIAGLL